MGLFNPPVSVPGLERELVAEPIAQLGDRWNEANSDGSSLYPWAWEWDGTRWLGPELVEQFSVDALAATFNRYFRLRADCDVIFTGVEINWLAASNHSASSRWMLTLDRMEEPATAQFIVAFTSETMINAAWRTAGANLSSLSTHGKPYASYRARLSIANGTPGAITGVSTIRYRYVRKAMMRQLFPSLISGFSVHKINSGYSGPCMRLERSSDSAQQDFGFKGNVLDFAAISQWRGSSQIVRAVRFHDQISSRHIDFASGQQPTILTGGAFDFVAGNPALQFTGSQVGISNSAIFARFISAAVRASDAASDWTQGVVSGSRNTKAGGGTDFGLAIEQVAGVIKPHFTTPNFVNGVQSAVFPASKRAIASVPTQTPDWGDWLDIRVGSDRGLAGRNFGGFISEILLFGADESANQAAIATEMNRRLNYY